MMTVCDIMRTIIDLPDELVQALDRLSRREHISRAEAVRRAVTVYLEQELPAETVEAFGLWRDRQADALAYEDALREEWKP
jgi:metal-responsive CopG/Arc/MetJ family transcriptional regulator